MFGFVRPVWVVAVFSLSSLYFVVDVLLKAVGDTPIMKTKKWAVDRGRTVQSLAQFISRFLKLDASEQLVRNIVLYLLAFLFPQILSSFRFIKFLDITNFFSLSVHLC